MPLFIQEAEALTWRSPDYHICPWDVINVFLHYLKNVIGRTMRPEIGVVGSCSILVEVVCPNRDKGMAAGLCEA